MRVIIDKLGVSVEQQELPIMEELIQNTRERGSLHSMIMETIFLQLMKMYIELVSIIW